jgi:cytoskeleton protein RodZ
VTEQPKDAQLAAIEQPPVYPVTPTAPQSTNTAPSHPEPPPVVEKETPATERQAPASHSDEVAIAGESAVTQPPPAARGTLPLGQHYGTRNKDSRITLRLHGSTEVRVGKSAKQVFIDRALGAGDTYRVPNLTGLTLSAQDAGAVEIILDDTTIGFAGKEGVPAREISLDPKAVVQLQQGG